MFDAKEFVDEKIAEMKTAIKGRAVIACSGGVDSTVAAAIVSKAIGDRLLTVYVDTGFMRKGESGSVSKIFENLHLNYRIIDASDEFFSALKGVTEPETKRKIIGAGFKSPSDNIDWPETIGFDEVREVPQ